MVSLGTPSPLRRQRDRPKVTETATQQDATVGEIADDELAALETQQGATDEDDYSNSLDEEYMPIPRYSPRPHDAEGSSSAAPP